MGVCFCFTMLIGKQILVYDNFLDSHTYDCGFGLGLWGNELMVVLITLIA